jgi:hypothetical protein
MWRVILGLVAFIAAVSGTIVLYLKYRRQQKSSSIAPNKPQDDSKSGLF